MTRTRIAAAVLAALTVALAGCSSAPDESAPDESASDEQFYLEGVREQFTSYAHFTDEELLEMGHATCEISAETSAEAVGAGIIGLTAQGDDRGAFIVLTLARLCPDQGERLKSLNDAP